VVDPHLGADVKPSLQPAPQPRSRSAFIILRRRQVQAESGYSRSTIYLRISQGLWPRPISLGARAVGWPASEVDALNAARIAGKTDTDIRALVAKMQAARVAASD
jgi:prophage regulatory protein